MAESDSVRIAIVVPQVGEAIAEAHIVEWLVTPGDDVKHGDVLFVVDTEKAEVDIESFVDGTIEELLVDAGTSVMPGQRIGTMLVQRDKVPIDADIIDDGAKDPSESGGGDSRPAQATESVAPTGPVGASPLARKRAKELGIDIAAVVAAVGGNVSVSDVEAFARDETGTTAQSNRLNRLRAAVATATTLSKREVPHFYVDASVDMTSVLNHKERAGEHATITTYVAAACAAAIGTHPEWNLSYADGGLQRRETVSIGIAVDTPDGLLVPVLTDVSGDGITDIQTKLTSAVARAKDQKLTGADHGPRSLVVSNLGMFGVDRFHAIINQPDPFILAVGSIKQTPAVVDGDIVVRPTAVLSVSADHRVIDGAGAARFLAAVVHHLETIDKEEQP